MMIPKNNHRIRRSSIHFSSSCWMMSCYFTSNKKHQGVSLVFCVAYLLVVIGVVAVDSGSNHRPTNKGEDDVIVLPVLPLLHADTCKQYIRNKIISDTKTNYNDIAPIIFHNEEASSSSTTDAYNFILDSVVSSICDKKHLATPQYKAYQWLLEEEDDDGIQYDDDDDDDESNNIMQQDQTLLSLAKQQQKIKERYILATLYYATNGPEWFEQCHFLDHSKDICEWNTFYGDGVLCDDKDGTIMLILDGNNLNGQLPTELGMLSRLDVLSCFDNILNGTIPSELGQLSKLFHLQFWANNLNGQIPTELGRLSSIKYLNLSENKISGTIPSELGQLSSLVDWGLSSNNIKGHLPIELGRLSKLKYLTFEDNQISGTIPSSFSRLSSLRTLWIYNNNVKGDAEFLCSLPNLQSCNIDKDKVKCRCCY